MNSVKLIGILNTTPNSFSDGGQFAEPEIAVERARQMFAEGAAIVDVGAEATNPFVEPLSYEQEWQRLSAILELLLREFPGRISVDTYHSETAARAFELGDIIINDVTTFRDPEMIALAARHNARCIVSHLPLDASSIKAAHANATLDSVEQVRDELLQQRQKLIDAGVSPENIILDPGIGFGKTMKLNWQLLEFAAVVPGIPVLIGHSKKRFLGENRFEIETNLQAAETAKAAGARYIRVHDVAGHAHLLTS